MDAARQTSFNVHARDAGQPRGRYRRAGAACRACHLPWWADSSSLRLFVEFACFLALAQMWNLLAGYGGLVSVGQQAFSAWAAMRSSCWPTNDVNPFLCVPLAGSHRRLLRFRPQVVFRLQGGYFAIGTWVVAEVYRLLIANTRSWRRLWHQFDCDARHSQGDAGVGDLLDCAGAGIRFGRVGLSAAALTLRSGTHCHARQRDAAASQGIDVRAKLIVYLISAVGCGLAARFTFSNLRISPDAAFGVNWTAYIIFIVVIGGIGTIEGPIIGTLLYFVLREFLGDFGTWYLIILGSVAIVTMVKFPYGLWGYARTASTFNSFQCSGVCESSKRKHHAKHSSATQCAHRSAATAVPCPRFAPTILPRFR